MKNILSQTKLYFFPTLLSVILGLIILPLINTGDVILAVSESRSEFWNSFFYWATKIGEEPFYLLLFIVFLFINIRYAIFIPIIGIVVTLVSYGLKSFFLHPRPKLFFEKMIANGEINIIDGVHMIGGLTSFPSGHTISGFCLFGFAAYVFRELKSKKLLQFLCFLLAFIVGFSRIYLFQHFLKDVVLGTILGALLAALAAWACEKYLNEPGKAYNRSIKSYFSKSATPKA